LREVALLAPLPENGEDEVRIDGVEGQEKVFDFSQPPPTDAS
jgi:hypothetical protein